MIPDNKLKLKEQRNSPGSFQLESNIPVQCINRQLTCLKFAPDDCENCYTLSATSGSTLHVWRGIHVDESIGFSSYICADKKNLAMRSCDALTTCNDTVVCGNTGLYVYNHSYELFDNLTEFPTTCCR